MEMSDANKQLSLRSVRAQESGPVALSVYRPADSHLSRAGHGFRTVACTLPCCQLTHLPRDREGLIIVANIQILQVGLGYGAKE